MKRILFTTNIPAPYTVQFFNLLGEKFDLTVTYERQTAKNRVKEWFTENGIKFKEKYLKGIKYGEEAACCPGIIKYLKMDYDLIIIGNYSSLTGIIAILYLSCHKRPFFIHVDGGIIAENEGLKKNIKSFLLSRAKGFFSPGTTVDEYIKYYAGSSKIIHHYPFSSIEGSEIVTEPSNHVNKRLTLKRLEPDISIEENDFVLVSVGSIIHRKGYDILLKALSYLDKDIAVLIIGGKPDKELETIIQNQNLDKVHFIEFKEHSVIMEYIGAADAFVLPTRYDIWGLVINEALAAGVPIITSNKCVAGVELVKDEYNGFIFESENSTDLAKCINRIKNMSEDERNTMARNSISIAEKYTIEKMEQHYTKGLNQSMKQ